MSAKPRVSQIILLFGYRYRLHQVILGIQGESSCSMSVIKGKSCIFREYNRINGKTCCVDIARVYGIFDTEQFEIIESRITDITIFRKMVEKLNDFRFENEKYKENNPNFDINIVKLMCNNKV